MNYDQHSPTNEFIDSLSSHMLLSDIVQTARVRKNFKTLVDNIYSNVITLNNISVILLPQYLTIFSSASLVLAFSQIHHLQNQVFLKEIGPSLIEKT